MSAISMILVVIVAFLAGMEGVLDEFQFHQPLIACTLIGLVTGHLVPCVMLGGSLQMIALGWANIGAAVAPDAALAAVASTIIFIQSGGEIKQIGTAIAVAIPLAVAGLFLTMIVRTISVAIIHIMDKEAAKANFRGVDLWQMLAVSLQGLRIAIPAAAMLFVPASAVRAFLGSMPAWLTDGMTIGGCRWLCNGYQHDCQSRSMAVLYDWFCPGCRFRTYLDRNWGDWSGINADVPVFGIQGRFWQQWRLGQRYR